MVLMYSCGLWPPALRNADRSAFIIHSGRARVKQFATKREKWVKWDAARGKHGPFKDSERKGKARNSLLAAMGILYERMTAKIGKAA